MQSSEKRSEKERLTELLAECYFDPDLFNSTFLDRPPYWPRQIEMGDEVVRHRAVAVETGNAIGKDYWVAGLILWWLCTRFNSLVIVTGPSQTLLGTVTWKEIRRALQNAPLLRSLTTSDGIKTSPQTVTIAPGWQALGYSTTSVERASGQHAGQLLVVVEEASAVEPPAWEAIDGLKYTKLVAIGNPLRPDGGFVDLILQAEEDRRLGVPAAESVCHINIPSTESPHAHLDHSPVGLADRTWLDAMQRKHGRDSLWYRTHVLAIRPKESHEALIPLAHLDYATRDEHKAAVFKLRKLKPTPRRIACDLGEGVGKDRTVIVVRDDYGILELRTSAFVSEDEAAAQIAALAEQYSVGVDRITYDAAGATGKKMGAKLRKYNLVGCRPYFGAGSGGRRYTNLRTGAAMALAFRLDPEHCPGAPGIKQPPFHIQPAEWWPALREQLANLRYDLVGDKSRLETKEDAMDRLGESPDLADAVCQSFAYPND